MPCAGPRASFLSASTEGTLLPQRQTHRGARHLLLLPIPRRAASPSGHAGQRWGAVTGDRQARLSVWVRLWVRAHIWGAERF